MSKLVVKIRDDDKNFLHCPLQHEGYCHLPQTHYWLGNALYMQQCLGIINKKPPWCPLKEEKEAIPIEWIIDWLTKQSVPATSYGIDYSAVEKMLEDWEEENEAD